MVADTVASALSLELNFAGLTRDDPLLNFPVPQSVGVGIARGSATRLTGDGKTLDYSGYPLNLASRLMDLARPRGVVFDVGIGEDLVGEGLLKRFDQADVYLRGLAEVEPLSIRKTQDVDIPLSNRAPIGVEIIHEEPFGRTLAQLRKLARYRILLRSAPVAESTIRLEIEWLMVDGSGNKHKTETRGLELSEQARTYSNAGTPALLVDFSEVLSFLESEGVKPRWQIHLHVSYAVPLGTIAGSRGGESSEMNFSRASHALIDEASVAGDQEGGEVENEGVKGAMGSAP